jgi:adenosine deaminase
LRSDYEFTDYGNFQQFQACFNLLIALFPLNPKEDSITRHILNSYAKTGVNYAEFRTPLGRRFVNDAARISDFLSMLARVAIETEQETLLHPRFAISLPRDLQNFRFPYACLKDWMQKNRDLSRMIVAIDFCGFEEESSPEEMQSVFKLIQEDNAQDHERALAILYHVGETFQSISIEDSIHWVQKAHDAGAHRLGHCTSLGIDPRDLVGPLYTEERRENIRCLQEKTLAYLRNHNAILECCPISNTRIGNIHTLKHHPLRRFVTAGLNVVLSSDDPGIFVSSLHKEEHYAQIHLKLSTQDIQSIAKIAQSSHSEYLVKNT